MAQGPTRTLFITPAYVKENTVIDSNTEDKLIKIAIKKAQDQYIRKLISSGLYNNLIDRISGNTLTAQYQVLMDDYIIPCLLDYTVYMHLPTNTYKQKNKGNVQQTDPNSQAVDNLNLGYTRADVLDSAQYYGEELIKHIKANMNLFPEYNQLNTLEDVAGASEDYFSGIQFPNSYRGRLYDPKYRTEDLNW